MSVLNRVGIIGDVHAEDVFLETALCFLQSQNLDALLCVGDIVDGTDDANRCCELLQQFDVHTVRGNHDRWILANEMRHLPDADALSQLSISTRHYLEHLPLTLRFQTVAGDLLLCHGLGNNDMARLTPDDFGYALEMNKELQQLLRSNFRFVIGGHTHRRMVRTIENVTFINAGTLFHQHSPGFALTDFDQRKVQWLDFTSGEVQAAETTPFDSRCA